MFRRALLPWLFAVLVAGFCCGGVLADASKPANDQLGDEEDVYELHKLLVDALDQVERNYVRDVSRRELIEAAIRGIVKDLDPYSSYINSTPNYLCFTIQDSSQAVEFAGQSD